MTANLIDRRSFPTTTEWLTHESVQTYNDHDEKKPGSTDVDETQSDPPPAPVVVDFPDGGLRAWLVVAGVSGHCALTPSYSHPLYS